MGLKKISNNEYEYREKALDGREIKCNFKDTISEVDVNEMNEEIDHFQTTLPSKLPSFMLPKLYESDCSAIDVLNSVKSKQKNKEIMHQIYKSHYLDKANLGILRKIKIIPDFKIQLQGPSGAAKSKSASKLVEDEYGILIAPTTKGGAKNTAKKVSTIVGGNIDNPKIFIKLANESIYKNDILTYSAILGYVINEKFSLEQDNLEEKIYIKEIKKFFEMAADLFDPEDVKRVHYVFYDCDTIIDYKNKVKSLYIAILENLDIQSSINEDSMIEKIKEFVENYDARRNYVKDIELKDIINSIWDLTKLILNKLLNQYFSFMSDVEHIPDIKCSFDKLLDIPVKNDLIGYKNLIENIFISKLDYVGTNKKVFRASLGSVVDEIIFFLPLHKDIYNQLNISLQDSIFLISDSIGHSVRAQKDKFNANVINSIDLFIDFYADKQSGDFYIDKYIEDIMETLLYARLAEKTVFFNTKIDLRIQGFNNLEQLKEMDDEEIAEFYKEFHNNTFKAEFYRILQNKVAKYYSNNTFNFNEIKLMCDKIQENYFDKVYFLSFDGSLVEDTNPFLVGKGFKANDTLLQVKPIHSLIADIFNKNLKKTSPLKFTSVNNNSNIVDVIRDINNDNMNKIKLNITNIFENCITKNSNLEDFIKYLANHTIHQSTMRAGTYRAKYYTYDFLDSTIYDLNPVTLARRSTTYSSYYKNIKELIYQIIIQHYNCNNIDLLKENIDTRLVHYIDMTYEYLIYGRKIEEFTKALAGERYIYQNTTEYRKALYIETVRDFISKNTKNYGEFINLFLYAIVLTIEDILGIN